MGDLSPHFSRAEFRCRHCNRLGPDRPLRHLAGHLELLRLAVARPIPIVSGWRCREHPVEAAKDTPGQHFLATAADIPHGIATIAQAERAGFTGIGDRRGYATHLDLRPKRARWHYY